MSRAPLSCKIWAAPPTVRRWPLTRQEGADTGHGFIYLGIQMLKLSVTRPRL